MSIIAYWDNDSDFRPDPGVVNNGLELSPESYAFGSVMQPFVPVSSSATFMSFPVDLSPGNSFFTRFYMSTPFDWSSTATNVLTFRPNASSTAFSIAFSGSGQPGQVRVVGTGGTILANSGNNTILENETLFIEIGYYELFEGSTKKLDVYVYRDGEVAWAADMIDVSSVFTSNITRIDWGKTTSTNLTSPFRTWAFALDDNYWIGYHPDDPALNPGGPSDGPAFALYSGGELHEVFVGLRVGDNITDAMTAIYRGE